MKDTNWGLILRPANGGSTMYYFEVKGQHFGPYQFASIAIMNKIKEEGRNINNGMA